MDIKLPELEYGYLISHTFPGLFLAFEIIICFSLFTPIDLFGIIYSIDYKIINLIGLLISLYVISTILGIILDGIHHYIFEKWEDEGKSLEECVEIYEHIKSIEQLQIYRQTLDKDYWYYYECYANIAIAMIPGIMLFPYWFYKLSISILFIIVFLLFYIIIIVINIQQALSTLAIVNALDKALIKNFKSAGQPAED
jgi:hypothetical protein